MSDSNNTDVAQVDVSTYNRDRMLLTAVILLIEIIHLGWEHLHGGVRAHHLLHRADLPSISNWWGLILLPGLGWFLIGRMQRRVADSQSSDTPKRIGASIWLGFAVSLLFGVVLAFATVHNYLTVASYMFLALFPIALVFPIYRSEYVLGFILGMTFPIGAVLPSIFALIFASISALAHLLIRFVRRLFAG